MLPSGIYLDHNATTLLHPFVKKLVQEKIGDLPLNPSSVHVYGRYARSLAEQAKQALCHALSADPQKVRVLFTSSGTEANNMAMKGFSSYALAVSAIEHASILKPAQEQEATIIPVDHKGYIDLNFLETWLTQTSGPKLVSVMLANNETGIIQPIESISTLVHAHGGLLHCDAIQGLGKIPVRFSPWHIDLMTVTAHKCGGPQGIGALILGRTISLTPLMRGGGQAEGLRPGTENMQGIVGFGIAALEAANCSESERLAHLRNKMEETLRHLCPTVRIVGEESARLPNTSCILMPDVQSELQLVQFDLAGIAVSAGSACSSGKITTSHVLQAMGIAEEEARCAIRVSLGRTTTEQDISHFIACWQRIYEKSFTVGTSTALSAARESSTVYNFVA